MGGSCVGPGIQVRDPSTSLGFRLWSVPTLAVGAIFRVTQQIEDLFVYLSACTKENKEVVRVFIVEHKLF